MPRTFSTLARGSGLALAAALLSSLPASAQAHYAGTLQAGSAFVLDLDDPDPPGSYSVSATLDRRYGDRALSVGLEAGFHRFLAMRQDLTFEPGRSASFIRDTRSAWRFTPYLRWATRESTVRLYGQTGLGLYIQRFSYAQRETEDGVVTFDVSSAFSDLTAGLPSAWGSSSSPGLVLSASGSACGHTQSSTATGSTPRRSASSTAAGASPGSGRRS